MTNTASKNQICLVGNGRLAKQLKIQLEHLNLNHHSNSEALKSSTTGSIEAPIKSSPFHNHVFRAQNSETQIESAISQSGYVWLAISDESVESFYQRYSGCADETTIWVHFSGAHNSRSLYSAHPLMTFSGDPISSQDFQKVHFTLSLPSSIPESAELSLNDLLPHFQNPWSRLPSDQKALYHALCVLGGNFPTILWSEVQKQFQNLSIPDSALFNYLDRTLDNFKKQGPHALTGPLARKDFSTIKSNLKSLEGHPFKNIYESFLTAKGLKI